MIGFDINYDSYLKKSSKKSGDPVSRRPTNPLTEIPGQPEDPPQIEEKTSDKKTLRPHSGKGHFNYSARALERAAKGLDLQHSRNWVYYDALQANYRQMVNDEEADFDEAQKNRLQSVLNESNFEIKDSDDLLRYQSNPEWAKIKEIRDRYRNAMKKLDDIAARARAELKIDIRKSIQPWWCVKAKSALRKPREKETTLA